MLQVSAAVFYSDSFPAKGAESLQCDPVVSVCGHHYKIPSAEIQTSDYLLSRFFFTLKYGIKYVMY